MKFLEAFKDEHGYHFEVTMDEMKTDAPRKLFNYGLAPGKIGKLEPILDDEEKDTGQKIFVMVDESEADYVARIEQEIITVCTQLKAGVPTPPLKSLASKAKVF